MDRRRLGSSRPPKRKEWIDLDDVMLLRHAVAGAFVHEAVARWIVDLVRATRELEIIAIGR